MDMAGPLVQGRQLCEECLDEIMNANRNDGEILITQVLSYQDFINTILEAV